MDATGYHEDSPRVTHHASGYERAAAGDAIDVSVIIPTHQRVSQLETCLCELAQQQCEGVRFEVLVGVDGEDCGEQAVFDRTMAGMQHSLIVHSHKAGPAATRNALIERATGKLLLFLNDDVVPDRMLVQQHVLAHRQQQREVMILGAAPWAIVQPDRLFDRLIRETSMVFFYDQMHSAPPEHNWGFRHTWTLNLSVPAHMVRHVGGFCEGMNRPVYEDLEFGWKLKQAFDLPLLYRPALSVLHVHRYEPLAFLKRDAVLGHQAWRLAEVAPECALAMFGTDVCSEVEVAYTHEFLSRQQSTAVRHVPMFLKLADIPSDVVTGQHAPAIIRMLYEQGLLLRRYLWRLGHLAAAEGRSPEDAASWLNDHIA
jgi:GT2 family glycosyltransferase